MAKTEKFFEGMPEMTHFDREVRFDFNGRLKLTDFVRVLPEAHASDCAALSFEDSG